MLIALTVISFLLAILFLLAYIFATVKKKKSNKAKGAASVVFFAIAIVLLVIFLKQNNIKLFNKVKAYDAVQKFTQTSDTGYVADSVYYANKSVYFTNGKNDLFVIDKNGATTAKNGITSIGGKRTITAELSQKGELILNGHFKYSEYESERHEYNNTVIAKDVTKFSITDNSLMYITADGKLYALGFNEYGHLGDTTTKNKNEPVLVTTDIIDCDISDTHSMVVDKYNTLYAVGDNSYSQYGTKTTIASTEFTKIMQGVKDVRVGNYYSLVLAVNGELFTSGDNELGQLGNGGSNKVGLISILKGVKKIDRIGNTCAALTNDGELYVWGECKDIELSPVKVLDNVYDFALTDDGIAVIDKNRNVLVGGNDYKPETVLEFNAEIAEIEAQDTPDAV